MVVACALCAWAAAGWPSDNRLRIWFDDESLDPGFKLLREHFRGDEGVMLRADEFSLEDEDALAWLQELGPRLLQCPGADGILEPFSLPLQVRGNPLEMLQQASDRPLVAATRLFSLNPPRVDYFVGLHPNADQATRNDMALCIEGLQNEAKQLHGIRLRAAGHPILSAALDWESAKVRNVFAPLLGTIALLGIAIALRSFLLGVLTLLPAILALNGFAAGLRVLQWPSNLILVIGGPLTFVLLVASTLHLISTFRLHLAQGMAQYSAAVQARKDKWMAGILAALTTAVGFGVFALSGVIPIRRLGIGVALAMLILVPLMLGVLPTLMAHLPILIPKYSPVPGKLWRAPVRVALRYGLVLHLLTLLVFTLGAMAPFQLHQDSSSMDYFPKGHPIREQFEQLETEGGGLSTIEILVRPQAGGSWSTAQFEDQTLSKRLLELEHVTGVFGPGEVAEELRHASGLAARALLKPALKSTGRLSESGEWLHWTARLLTSGSYLSRELVDSIEATVAGWAEPSQHRFYVSGTTNLILLMQERLVSTLFSSLMLTVLATTCLFLLIVRTPRELLAVVVTNLFPVACSLIATWFLGFPLDAATAMVAAVVLGLAVDNTFHILYATGKSDRSVRGTFRAFEKVGEAAAVSSLALALGFAVLAFSGFPPTSRFGLLTGIGAFASMVSNLFVLPAFLNSAWQLPFSANKTNRPRAESSELADQASPTT